MSEEAVETNEEETGMAFEDAEGDLSVDLSSVEEDAGLEAIPRGTYDVVVEECEFKHSQSSGNPMWSLTLVVENNEDYDGRKLFTHIVFSEKMMGRAKKTLNILGCADLLQGPFNPADDDVTEKLIGKQARATVSIREYEGEKRNEVKNLKVRPAGDGFGDA